MHISSRSTVKPEIDHQNHPIIISALTFPSRYLYMSEWLFKDFNRGSAGQLHHRTPREMTGFFFLVEKVSISTSNENLMCNQRF